MTITKKDIEKELDLFFEKNKLPKTLENDDDSIESLNIRWVYSVAEKLGITAERVVKVYNTYYDACLDLLTF